MARKKRNPRKKKEEDVQGEVEQQKDVQEEVEQQKDVQGKIGQKSPLNSIESEEFHIGDDITNLTVDDIKENNEEEIIKRKKQPVPKRLTKKMISDDNDDKEISFRMWILKYRPLHNVLSQMKASLKDKSLNKIYKKKELDELHNSFIEE